MSELAGLLSLEPHVEGGWFRQLYESAGTIPTEHGPRPFANTIHYLLAESSPVGFFHRNRSDITHFLHLGGPVRYLLLSPEGELDEVVVGADLEAGQVLSFTAPGGCWKSSHLMPGVRECLISEVVTPGFRYEDHELATVEGFERDFPHLVERLRPWIR